MIKDVKRKKEEKKKVHFGLDKCLVVEMNVIRISQIDFYEILLYTKKNYRPQMSYRGSYWIFKILGTRNRTTSSVWTGLQVILLIIKYGRPLGSLQCENITVPQSAHDRCVTSDCPSAEPGSGP